MIMGQPHKYAELIKAWADGAEIQSRVLHGKWVTCKPAWSIDPQIEYRIKPKEIRYRNFLWKSEYCDKEVVSVVTEEENKKDPRCDWGGFITWLGDWQEVEV